jgi:hypothetical protein
MGYTHYWDIRRPLTPTEMTDIANDVRAIVDASGVPIAGWDGYGEPEYGKDRIALNGANPDGHETFAISAKGGWDCCKTRQDAYDIVVTASLLALKDMLGIDIALSSDGDPADWIPGHTLAERALDRKIITFNENET